MASKAKTRKNAIIKKSEKSLYSPVQIKKFLDEVRAEFRKIVWPPGKATLGLAGIVILLTVIIAAYLGSVDVLLGKLVSYLLK